MTGRNKTNAKPDTFQMMKRPLMFAKSSSIELSGVGRETNKVTEWHSDRIRNLIQYFKLPRGRAQRRAFRPRRNSGAKTAPAESLFEIVGPAKLGRFLGHAGGALRYQSAAKSRRPADKGGPSDVHIDRCEAITESGSEHPAVRDRAWYAVRRRARCHH